MKDRNHDFKVMEYLFPSSAFLAVGISTWYVFVSNRPQNCLVAGPLETISMLLMAPYFLSQRRSKVQIVDTDI